MRLRSLFSGLAVAVALAVAAVAPAQAVTPDDQLVIGMSLGNVLSMDPAEASSRESTTIRTNIYDMLIELDTEDPTRIEPGLATDWSVSEDGRVLTFTVREGVTFHSGNPLTVEDVVWSLHRVVKLNLAGATVWKSYGYTPENVEQYIRAVDDSTIEVEIPTQIDPILVFFSLARPDAGVLDRVTVLEHERDGDMGNAWLATNDAGSGAFTLRDWQANSLVLLERFDDYWRGPATLSRVIIRHMPESQTQRLMLERGDIDVAGNLSVPDIRALESNDDVVVQLTPEGGFYYVAVSMADEKFQDIRVRQAIRYLIDYEGINNTIMPNYGVLHQGPVQAGLPQTLPDPGYTLDPERAQALLAEAGYPDGFDATLRVLSDTPFIDIATSVQNTLAQGGIRAEIISGGGGVVYDKMRERDFEILIGRGGGGGDPHPYSNLRNLAYNPDNSDEAQLVGFQGWRASFYDEEMNRLIDEALVETDVERQTELYLAAQERYHELAAPIQPISQVITPAAMRADLRNLVFHRAWTTRFHGVVKER